MMDQNVTDFWHGTMLWAAFGALVATPPLAWLLIRWYRKSVLKAMLATRGTDDGSIGTRPSPAPAPARDLEIDAADASRPAARPARPAAAALYRLGLRSPRSIAWVYGVAGAVHAAVAVYLLFTFNELEFFPRRTLVVYLVLLWPVVPTVLRVAAAVRWLWITAPLAYFGASLLLSGDYFLYLLALWGLTMGIPVVAYAIVFLRPWRTVGPWVFLTAFFVFMGLFLGRWSYLHTSVAALRSDLGGARLVGVGAGIGVFLVWCAIGLGLFVAVSRGYRARWFSDQMLEIDVLWLLFTLCQCSYLAVTHGGRGFLGLLAFVAYRAVVGIGLRFARGRTAGGESLPLLLLRVFGSRRRSEELIRFVGTHWRYLGPIRMIAGTDLAVASLEPHEFLEFATGRLRQRFVGSRTDLERQLEEIDVPPDPDGRYRVHEFFCHDDTWRLTLKSLVRRSRSVLMDLRTFSRQNQGCVFEIRQLLALVPVAAIVFLVDATTDEGFLRETLRQSWREVGAGSASRDDPEPRVRLLRLSPRPSGREERRLLEVLCEATPSPRRRA